MATYKDETEVILAIDCLAIDLTLSVPDETKIKKICNTAKDLTQKIKKVITAEICVSIIPVLVSFVDCSGYKSVARKYQVKLIDRNDLENLYDLLIIKGLKDDALRTLYLIIK